MNLKPALKNNGATSQEPSIESTGTLFNPIKTSRAFEAISTEIKELIFKGALKPGDRLPSETELAGRFGVGRQTIREALRLLELSGFISMQKGGSGGPLVVNTILNTIGNSYLDIFRMQSITIDEVTRARVQIEKVILANVIVYATDSDIELLRTNIVMAQTKIARGIQAFEENIDFHKILAQASRNQVFVVVMEAIAAVVAHLRTLLGMDMELSSRAVSEHEELLEAIIRKEKDKAMQILERHLLHVDRKHKDFFSRHIK
jgi:GntR family transcriptional regulator, transcriptional repressor for pyruvate dehydrogenase complex